MRGALLRLSECPSASSVQHTFASVPFASYWSVTEYHAMHNAHSASHVL